jgi:hypothetical protein
MKNARHFSDFKVLGATVGFLFMMSFFGLSQKTDQAQSSSSIDLQSLLAKLSNYAQRLENSVLDFICREEISEKIDYLLDDGEVRPLADAWSIGAGVSARYRRPAVINNSFVYDYQCIRINKQIRETRMLLEENKIKKNEPNAKLKTSNFVYQTVLLGPVGIFAERYLPFYEYKITGQDKIGKKRVVIIEATPVIETPHVTNLYGKVWVDPATADILKIQWSEKRVGRFNIFEERANRYNLKPRITLHSEFSAEKNGIRFPSSLFIEEAYINERGRATVRSETSVKYKDFKFFTVKVEIH